LHAGYKLKGKTEMSGIANGLRQPQYRSAVDVVGLGMIPGVVLMLFALPREQLEKVYQATA